MGNRENTKYRLLRQQEVANDIYGGVEWVKRAEKEITEILIVRKYWYLEHTNRLPFGCSLQYHTSVASSNIFSSAIIESFILCKVVLYSTQMLYNFFNFRVSIWHSHFSFRRDIY